MQGRLRKEHLEVTIRTECAQSGKPIHLTVDSDLKCNVEDEGAEPLVFEPEVDWEALREPNIIRVY